MPADGVLAALVDLVLPAECAGCRATRVPLRSGVCAGCVAVLEGLSPHPVRPTPAPSGLPPCVALGAYEGVLRETVLSYKERGRHGLGRPLGALLAEVVVSAVVGGNVVAPDARHVGPRPVVLVPVPATARAARERHGDHVARLARHAARRLRSVNWPVTMVRAVRALPRPDSVGLDAEGRAAVARTAFQVNAEAIRRLRSVADRRTVVVLDDIVTTGATLAAIAGLFRDSGVSAAAAAVLAGTVRRRPV